MSGREGVIRFRFEHRREVLGEGLAEVAAEVAGWRRVLIGLGVVGRDPARYGGSGFGNLSARVGADAFLVTGSQTGHLRDLDLGGFALVESWVAAEHRLTSRGLVEPSSESLTHAALYEASPAVGAVFHVHSPALWERRGAPGLPTTSAGIDYGTAEMAAEVARLCRLAPGPAVIAMGGHADGILAYGPDPGTTARTLLAALAA
jgi:hypothetical protein